MDIVKTKSGTVTNLAKDFDAAKEFAANEKSEATRKAYRADVAIFTAWCKDRSVKPLGITPELLAAFIGSQAKDGLSPSTLHRRLAAIRYAHRLAEMDSPTENEKVRATMRGIRRTWDGKKKPKAPATADKLMAMVGVTPDTLLGCRDRAILLLGFAGAFRRSELAALQISDLEETEEGLRVHIHRSKTDQAGEGQVVPIIRGQRTCPVAAVLEWIEAAGIKNGPLFPATRSGSAGVNGNEVLAKALSTKSIGNIVKKYAEKAGFDPAEFGGHSLRSGFLTSAASNGASIFKMMDISRHKSVETLRGYVRAAEEFKDHAGAGLL